MAEASRGCHRNLDAVIRHLQGSETISGALVIVTHGSHIPITQMSSIECKRRDTGCTRCCIHFIASYHRSEKLE